MQVIAFEIEIAIQIDFFFFDEAAFGRIQRLIQMKQKSRMSFGFYRGTNNNKKKATLNYNELKWIEQREEKKELKWCEIYVLIHWIWNPDAWTHSKIRKKN